MSDLNDPRVFLAAERTLLAWSRTSLTLMAFGFVVERFGLFLHMLIAGQDAPFRRSSSFWVGLAFVVLGMLVAILSLLQHRRLIRSLAPVEIPAGYWVNLSILTNFALAILGLVLTAYLFRGVG